MTRNKRHIVRRIALGLAVATVVPATAQARPVDLSGTDARAIHAQAVVTERAVVGAEDVAFSRRSAGNPTVVTAGNEGGYDAGTGSVVGLLLILTATGAAVALHHGRKAKLSPA